MNCEPTKDSIQAFYCLPVMIEVRANVLFSNRQFSRLEELRKKLNNNGFHLSLIYPQNKLRIFNSDGIQIRGKLVNF